MMAPKNICRCTQSTPARSANETISTNPLGRCRTLATPYVTKLRVVKTRKLRNVSCSQSGVDAFPDGSEDGTVLHSCFLMLRQMQPAHWPSYRQLHVELQDEPLAATHTEEKLQASFHKLLAQVYHCHIQFIRFLFSKFLTWSSSGLHKVLARLQSIAWRANAGTLPAS